MKLSKRSSALVATAIAGAMLMTACGGSDSGGGSSSASTGGSFSLYVGEPENPLVPGNTTESEGTQIEDALWTGLVTYTSDGATEYKGVADSIESDDSMNWTVKLKDGWTFHDGTPVNAKSFVDAWNYTAYSPNAQGASSFYSLVGVKGVDEMQAPTDADGNPTGEPAAKEMSGLKVVDDLTFTVELTRPFTQFPTALGYNAFYPLPESFFADPEAAGKKPIGNGPFKADGEFVPGKGITVSKYADYAGENKANADSVEFRVYTDVSTAYTDVQGGNLDVLNNIPPDAISSAKDEFGDRYGETASSTFTYVGFPTYDPRFADKRVRQAFSMAIDRQAIIDAIFNGSRKPAYSVLPPTMDGFREKACQYCEVDKEQANKLLDEAGFDRSKPVDLWFNAGAGHDAWMEAVGNQLRENLGVEYVLKGDLDFAEYLPLQDAKGMTGPFRLAWGMDYPSPQDYLEPLFGTAALPPGGSNATFYSNPKFDDLVAQGNAAPSNDDAVKLYQQAEDLLLEDMPIAPMWFGLEQTVWSDKVSDVSIDIFGNVNVAAVTVK